MDRQVNAIRCKKCDTILISKHRHDYQSCDCENQTFVDGGQDYCRYGGIDLLYVEVLEDHQL